MVDVEKENHPVSPEAAHTFRTPGGEILGHLVIDSTVNGICGGGLRMVPEISLYELSHLARAMTLKYALLKLPLGGAKAAIVTHKPELSPEERSAAIRAFSRNLRPFRGKYSPGKDIGVGDEELGLVMNSSGAGPSRTKTDSAFYTALTVLLSAELLAEKRGLVLGECSLAIEGLGKVGGWVARLFSERGCKVVAVSTRKGGLHAPEGLDVEGLERLKRRAGDGFVLESGTGRVLDREEILCLPVDLLIPCGGSWSITLANAHRIRAKVIVCGANNPVTDRAKEELGRRGTTYFPDFVSNCGGVLGSILERSHLKRTEVTDCIRERVGYIIREVIALSGTGERSLEAVAGAIAEARLREMRSREKRLANRVFSIALRALRYGWIPEPVLRCLAPFYGRRIAAPVGEEDSRT
ncbi:MAG: Glu/Leu/Phe/Val dehydrogenase dimerization domain-containing protein [Thermodesulfobacteriota bacterium]